ncbi:GDSL-type esterase/lipase family protein [Leifsonia sp. NPDC058292]|uniref:GDSL-type esterase/lipase family protein n=1 Tax=Leifsonia sp. NPDC058292 TaxID=3346428 RepID=UPI0036D8E337
MYELTRTSIAKALAGAPGAAVLGWGVSVTRLPEWASRQSGNKPAVDSSASKPSGARLRFSTRASWIELTAIFTVVTDGSANARMAEPVLALTTATTEQVVPVRDVVVRLVPAGAVLELKEEGATSIRFDVPEAGGEQALSLWLPHNCAVVITSITADEPLKPARPSGPLWTHYGSSISQCDGTSTPLGVWPVIAARELGLDLTSFALAGQAHLDQFVARALREVPADLISLKLGINIVNAASMRLRAFVPAVHGFLDTVRERQPLTPILIISPIFCPAHEDAPGPSIGIDGYAYSAGLPFVPGDGQLTLREIRRLLMEVVEERSASDANIHYLDGLGLFGPEDADLLLDGLHPNEEGYRLIGSRFVDAVGAQIAGWVER